MKLKLPFLKYSQIGEESQQLLKQYWPSLTLPIPIEDIIDVKMGINIFPLPRLYIDFRQDGFLTADRKTIYVDEIQYDNYHKKYRFTIAHELGHYILHKECYENLSFQSTKEYIKWKASIPSEELDWFETQAHWFAAQILVPKIWLKKVCLEVINEYHDQLLSLTKIPDDFWSYASNMVARRFDVSPPVIQIRMEREKLIEEIPIR